VGKDSDQGFGYWLKGFYNKYMSLSECRFRRGGELLFRIVCRIGKYTRVKTPPDTITALDDHSMFVCFQEFTIEND